MSDNALVKVLKNRPLFSIHLFFYVATMGLLILIWALTGAGYFWPYFAMFGWGFGIGFHALVYLMYNDKVDYLTKVKQQSTFSILFIFHAWFYISVNVFLIIINLSLRGSTIFFTYPLFFWGIAFFFHALGFFFWESAINKEMDNFKRKFPDYAEKRLKMMATSKITNFWLVIIHIGYYIIVNIWLFSINITNTSELARITENTIFGWGTVLVVHLFSYILFYHTSSDFIKPVMKGLIIHIAFYVAGNGWQLYEFYKKPSNMFWPMFSLILWGILIAYHAYITFNWNSIFNRALKTIKKQFGENIDEYQLRSKARWFVFWMWSFIGHATMWAVGIILIGIQFYVLKINMGLLIHPAMGWLIGVCIHGSLYIIVLKNIQGFWKQTALIHLAAFISTGVYLVILNALYSTFPWSAIALGGWAIGLGFHLLVAHFINQ